MKRAPVEVRPYVWDPQTDPHAGVILIRGQYIKIFIPHEEIPGIADALIDAYEAQDRAGVETWTAQRTADLTPADTTHTPTPTGR